MPGRSVRLFFADGDAGGVVTAEVMNWTGHVLVTPRSKLGIALAREEAERTGVYILIGEDPEKPSRNRIYVGEGDNVAKRIKMHAKDEDKEFWTRAVLVTSKDMNLTKAHVRHLEGEIVRAARQAGRASIANGNEPSAKPLPEADISDMAVFLDNLEAVLPAIGMDFLRPTKGATRSSADPDQESDSASLKLILNHRSGLTAHAIELNGEYIVQAGSQVQSDPGYSMNQYGDLRDQLIKDGTICEVESSRFLEFVEDYAFRSPSAAAAVIIGRNSNGRRNWKLANGQTLKQWQDSQLTQDDDPS
jgi:predicted GIY-YIG superfamily endonuclease